MCFLCVISAVIQYFASCCSGVDDRLWSKKHLLSASLLQANHRACCQVVLLQLSSINLPAAAVQSSNFCAPLLLVKEMRWSEDMCLRGPHRPSVLLRYAGAK
jgi:hypothetical protein